MSRRVLLLIATCVALFIGLACAASVGVPPSQKTPGRRFRAPAGCKADDQCPEFLGVQQFPYLDYLLPPLSRVYFREAAYPMISRIYATSDADGTHTALWQLRTVTVNAEPEGLMDPGFRPSKRIMAEKHILVPFLLDTAAAHVHVGTHFQRFVLKETAALEGPVHMSICNIRVPLPHADVRCVRSLGPSPMMHTDSDRKNIIGGSGAAVLIALQTLFDDYMARGQFKGCSTNPHVESSVECTELLEEIAERFIGTNPTLGAILSHVEPRDRGSPEAIQVTIAAMNRDRTAYMKKAIVHELNLLLQAPTASYFDDIDFIEIRRRHPDPSAAPPPPQQTVAQEVTPERPQQPVEEKPKAASPPVADDVVPAAAAEEGKKERVDEEKEEEESDDDQPEPTPSAPPPPAAEEDEGEF